MIRSALPIVCLTASAGVQSVSAWSTRMRIGTVSPSTRDKSVTGTPEGQRTAIVLLSITNSILIVIGGYGGRRLLAPAAPGFHQADAWAASALGVSFCSGLYSMLSSHSAVAGSDAKFGVFVSRSLPMTHHSIRSLAVFGVVRRRP